MGVETSTLYFNLNLLKKEKDLDLAEALSQRTESIIQESKELFVDLLNEGGCVFDLLGTQLSHDNPNFDYERYFLKIIEIPYKNKSYILDNRDERLEIFQIVEDLKYLLFYGDRDEIEDFSGYIDNISNIQFSLYKSGTGFERENPSIYHIIKNIIKLLGYKKEGIFENGEGKKLLDSLIPLLPNISNSTYKGKIEKTIYDENYAIGEEYKYDLGLLGMRIIKTYSKNGLTQSIYVDDNTDSTVEVKGNKYFIENTYQKYGDFQSIHLDGKPIIININTLEPLIVENNIVNTLRKMTIDGTIYYSAISYTKDPFLHEQDLGTKYILDYETLEKIDIETLIGKIVTSII